MVPDLAGRTGLLMSTDRPNTTNVIAALGRMKSGLEEHFGVTSAVGVSEAHSLADVAALLSEARAALAYRLVKGGSDPIRFTEVVITGPAYHYPLDDEIRLINSIKAGNDAAADAILESIYAANFAQPRLSIEMARCLMFDLISTMIKTMDSLLAGEEDADCGRASSRWRASRPATPWSDCSRR